jgi:hypothetical protein
MRNFFSIILKCKMLKYWYVQQNIQQCIVQATNINSTHTNVTAFRINLQLPSEQLVKLADWQNIGTYIVTESTESHSSRYQYYPTNSHPQFLQHSDVFLIQMVGITGNISSRFIFDIFRMIVGQSVPYTLALACRSQSSVKTSVRLKWW